METTATSAVVAMCNSNLTTGVSLLYALSGLFTCASDNVKLETSSTCIIVHDLNIVQNCECTKQFDETFLCSDVKCNPSCASNAYCVRDGSEKSGKCVCNKEFKGDGYVCQGYCTPKTLYDSTRNTSYTFPETLVGSIAYSSKKCPDTDRAVASVSCTTTTTNGKSKTSFQGLHVVDCKETIVDLSSKLENLSNKPAVELKEKEDACKTLQVLSTGSHTSEETTTFIKSIEVVIDLPAETTQAVAENALQCASNIMASSQQHDQKLTDSNKKDIQRVLVKIAVTVSLPENNIHIEINTPTINLQVAKTISNEITGTTEPKYSDVLFSNTETTYGNTTSIKKVNEIKIPANTLSNTAQNNKQCNNIGVYSYYHKNSSLFGQIHGMSNVSSLGVFCDGKQDLDIIKPADPFSIVYLDAPSLPGKYDLDDEFMKKFVIITGMKYDKTAEKWDNTGLLQPGLTSNGQEGVVIKSLTFGSFSYLFRSEKIASDIVLEIVSKVGCSLSIVGLALTILIFLFTEKLRQQKTTNVLINICLTLLASYLLFMLGVGSVNSELHCHIITASLHFLFLSSWLWMTINAFHMYFALVKPMKPYSLPTFSTYIIGYLIPLIIAVATACYCLVYLDPMNTKEAGSKIPDENLAVYYGSSYRYHNMCWIHDWSLYMMFLLPVAVMLMFNIAIFGTTLVKIIPRKTIQTQSNMKPRDKMTELFIVITLISMMGLTWLFGYLMLLSTNHIYLTATSWLFTIFNTLQGFLIFVMMCLRKVGTRKLWLHPLCNTLSFGLCFAEKESSRPKVTSSNTGTGTRMNSDDMPKTDSNLQGYSSLTLQSRVSNTASEFNLQTTESL